MKTFVIIFFLLVAFSFVSCSKKIKPDKHYSFSPSKPIYGFYVVVTSSAVFMYENSFKSSGTELTMMEYRLKNNQFVEETNNYSTKFCYIYGVLDGKSGPIIIGKSVADSKVTVLLKDTYHLLEPAISLTSIIKSRIVPGTDDFFVVCFDSNKKNEILSWYNQKSLRLHLGKQNDPFDYIKSLFLSTTSVLIEIKSVLFRILFTDFQSASSPMDISDFRIDTDSSGLIYWYQGHICNQKVRKEVKQETSKAFVFFSFRGKSSIKDWYLFGVSSPLFLFGGRNKVITIESNEIEQGPAISIDVATIAPIEGEDAYLRFCSYPYLAWTTHNDTKIHLISFSDQ
jgi:hypothetical protein